MNSLWYINQTPHNDICTGICGGFCCTTYNLRVMDVMKILSYADDNPGFREKLIKHLAEFTKDLKGISADEAIKNVKESLAKSPFSFVTTPDYLFGMDSLHKKKNNKKCLFYSNGCVVYEARPDNCRGYLCDLLEKKLHNTSAEQ